MGVLYSEIGKIQLAEINYKKAIEKDPLFAEAHRNLSSIIQYKSDDEHFLQMLEINEKGLLPSSKQYHLSFALAKAYNDIGDIEKSFHHYLKANAQRKELLQYNIETDAAIFERLKSTQELIKRYSISKTKIEISTTPIFIVGMPRSGTSLIEQIISSHSMVTGAGELEYIRELGLGLATDNDCITLDSIVGFRESYIHKIRNLTEGNPYITDKMPQNFRFIPLICAAFPEAKIIHVFRNPAATCWSNFTQCFAKDGISFAYSIDDIIEYYGLYTNLMKLWSKIYADQIYQCNYETITTNQRNETENLLNSIGIDWEEDCLYPHKNKRNVRTASQLQVRKKIYTGSSKSWEKFKPYVGSAFDGLPKNLMLESQIQSRTIK